MSYNVDVRDRFFFGLLRRRVCVVPSLSGWALLLIFGLAASWTLLHGLEAFLAEEHPIGGEALVVEGWIPDYALRQALILFRSGHYRLLIVTGGPLPPGMPYSSFGSYAALAGENLKAMGLPADSLEVVASPWTRKDRTYLEGLALRDWMQSRGRLFATVDLVSFSAHARRSRLLYAKALAGISRVGVYAPVDVQYDPRAWWKSSNGVRLVSDEAIGYLYAKLWFHP